MGDIWLFGLPDQHAVAFGQRARNALSGDAAAWSVLLNTFASAYRPPSLMSDGRFVVDPHPLANVAWHRPPDIARVPLVSDTVPSPDSPDIQWLLTYALLLTAQPRAYLDSLHFAYGWSDEIPSLGLLDSTLDREAHRRFTDALFEAPHPVPEQLWFVPPTVSGPHSYLSSQVVADLVNLEREAGLLLRLSERLQGDANDAYRAFGRDIATLRHIVALTALRGHALFVTYFAL